MTQGMIRFLSESMPGTEFRVVTLDEQTTDPLQAVLDQLPSEGSGPIMIVSLEKTVRSDQAEHPVLFNLNLSRPEWPRRLPYPVVLWVPEYVLALLGREAPDFLDWRSDTVYFLEATPLLSLDPELWRSELWDRMPEPLRRERIAELRSRLSEVQGEDRTDSAVYSEWLRELGDHLSVLGDFEEAECKYRAAVALEGDAADAWRLVLLHLSLVQIYIKQGRYSESLEALQKSEHLYPSAPKNPLTDPDELDQGERAEEAFRATLKSFREENNVRGTSIMLSSLGAMLIEKESLEEAERVLLEAIKIEELWGNSLRMAGSLGLLGVLYLKRGDLDKAQGAFLQALRIGEELGDRVGTARAYANLGKILQLRGNMNGAADMLGKARTIFSEIGALRMSEWTERQLKELAVQSTPSESKEGDPTPTPEPS